MGCNCKGVEKAQKIERIFKNHATNIKPKENVEKEGVTLFSIISKLFEVIGKFIFTSIIAILVFIILIPVLLFISIWNIFSKKELTVKLPIYWFKKYKKLADNVEFNVRDK